MLQVQKRICLMAIGFASCFLFVILSFFLITAGGAVFIFSVSALVFLLLMFAGSALYRNLQERLEYRTMCFSDTSLLVKYIAGLRACYTIDDFFELTASVLECEGDFSVLYVDRKKNYILYNSPDKLTCREETFNTLSFNFGEDWPSGVFFLGTDFGLVSSFRTARGFFIVSEGQHLYIFCRYIRVFDECIYEQLFEEFCHFQMRINIIGGLTKIAELSKEWEHLAETQRSFLPHHLPQIPHLELGAYFRPLINVSGDYYNVIPLDEDKTLVMLGDVSGKGLSAALVMGIVMNTVKILKNKEDLAGIVRAVDKAIKSICLQDKYTVLFIGIIDTKQMIIRYVNASMPDPLILTRSPDGYRIKHLPSNCSLIGIIDLGEITVAEQKLFRGDLLLMVSDGVCEAADSSGAQLGASELYRKVIKQNASKIPRYFIRDIADLVLSYSGSEHIRDDITMLAVKLDR